MSKRLFLFALLIGAGAYSNHIQACAFHLNVDISQLNFQTADHPLSLPVQLATNRAHKAKLIQRPHLPDTGEEAFRQVSWWLTLFAQQLQANHQKDAHLVVIDIPLWSEFKQGRRFMRIDVEPPIDHEAPVIALTQATLYSVANGFLSYEEAIEQNLIMSTY